MARAQPTRLRETNAAAPGEARVIDAKFKVVNQGARRSWFASFARWLLAFVAAGVIGFLIPILWVVGDEIFAMIRGE